MINLERGATFAQWPDDRPRPTEEEQAAAEARYHKSIRDYNLANPGNPDTSDFCCGLSFVMATYNRWIWWPFFFPDDPPVDPRFVITIPNKEA